MAEQCAHGVRKCGGAQDFGGADCQNRQIRPGRSCMSCDHRKFGNRGTKDREVVEIDRLAGVRAPALDIFFFPNGHGSARTPQHQYSSLPDRRRFPYLAKNPEALSENRVLDTRRTLERVRSKQHRCASDRVIKDQKEPQCHRPGSQ